MDRIETPRTSAQTCYRLIQSIKNPLFVLIFLSLLKSLLKSDDAYIYIYIYIYIYNPVV